MLPDSNRWQFPIGIYRDRSVVYYMQQQLGSVYSMNRSQKANPGELYNSVGSQKWHRHSINRKVLYTDRVKLIVEEANAIWLLDKIILAQKWLAYLEADALQVWTLSISDADAMLLCVTANGILQFEKCLERADFPTTRIVLYFVDNVIMIPSEYSSINCTRHDQNT